MDTAAKRLELIGEPITRDLARFYPVICAETFIGEDAAEAIRTFDPNADVRVVATNDEAAALIAAQDRVTAVLAISPRDTMAGTALEAQIRRHDATLMLLTTSFVEHEELACRTVTGDLPFTNETIGALLERLCAPEG